MPTRQKTWVIAFGFIILMVTAVAWSAPVPDTGQTKIFLPQTGQKDCYDTEGHTIPCTGTGQDGDVHAGVAWPDPRFTVNGDGTVTDNLTCLMWTINANLMFSINKDFDIDGQQDGAVNWEHALDWCNLYYAGYSDWRLPNRKEIFYPENPCSSRFMGNPEP